MSSPQLFSFDLNGKVVASEGLATPEPWVVKKSDKYTDRFFFYNKKTKKSFWSIDESLLNESNRELCFPPISQVSNVNIEHNVGNKDSQNEKEKLRKIENDKDQSKSYEYGSSLPTSFFKQLLLQSNNDDSANEEEKDVRNEKSHRSNSDQCKTSHSFDGGQHALSRQNNLTTPVMGALLGPSIYIRTDSAETVISACSSMINGSSSQIIHNQYEVLDGLGLGGFSTVVKVKEIHSKERYAMKVISKRKLSKQVYQDRINLELEIMLQNSSLEAPFCQYCYDSFESQYNVFFITDLIKGGDLFFHLAERMSSLSKKQHVVGFHEQEARIILAELYLALEHLHQHKYIHGDIKIENVMLDKNGHVKLVDFGLATRLVSDVQPMSAVGSLIYMAPELLFEKTGGRHTDWWAYGVLAHELLTGHTPWTSITDMKVIRREIRTVQVAPPRTLKLGPGLFISSLLRHNLQERLGSVDDNEIKKCKFFKSINFNKLLNLELPPAFVPGRINVTDNDRLESLSIYNELTNIHINEQKHFYDINTGKDIVSLDLGLPDASEYLVVE